MRYYKYLQFPPSLANIANIRQILEKAPSLAISWQIIPAEKILQIFPDNPICVAPFVWICAKLCSVQFEWRMFPSICIYSICAEVGGSNRRALEWSNWENVKFKSNLSELKQLTQHGQSCHLSHPVKDPICQNCEFEPKGNPFHPLCAAACAHRRKWGFGEGSRQLIGFGTQEYTKESTNTLSDTKLK